MRSARRIWSTAQCGRADFDRPQADLLTIEEDIAVAVATKVAGRLDPGSRRSLTARATTSATACDLFYRGNYDLAQRTEASVVRARVEYAAARQAAHEVMP